jgi:hypothetical protein
MFDWRASQQLRLNCPPKLANPWGRLPGDLTRPRIAKAPDEVVVHQPGRLHQRVADRRADKREAPTLQVL